MLNQTVVILIVGITFSIALPGLGELQGSVTSQTHGQSIKHLLKYTRALAVLRQRAMSICSTINGDSCTTQFSAKQFLVFSDTNQNQQRDAAEPILRILDLREGQWHFHWRTFRRKPLITFLANGLTYDNGTMRICSGSTLHQQLILSRSGRVRTIRSTNNQAKVCDNAT